MKLSNRIALLVLASLMTGFAQSVFISEFDMLPRGARNLAMGGTGGASSEDAFAPYYNPAALCRVQKPQFMIEYTPLWDLQDDFGTGTGVYPFDNRLAVAAGYSRLQINGIPRYDALPGDSAADRYNNMDLRSTGTSVGDFSDAYDLFSMSICKWHDFKISQDLLYKLTIPMTVSGGVSLRFFRQSFSLDPPFEGHSLDLDAGLLLSFILDKNLTDGTPTKVLKTGYSLKNMLAADISYNTDAGYTDAGERIRTWGFAYTQHVRPLQGTLSAALDLVRRGDEQVNRFGLEYGFREKLWLRGGYLDNGFTAGVGLRYKGFGLDYAFRQHEFANHPYQITLSVNAPR